MKKEGLMGNRKRYIHILTTGSYDDYQIVAVCSSKRIAEHAMNAAGKGMGITVESVPYLDRKVSVIVEWVMWLSMDKKSGTLTVDSMYDSSEFDFNAKADYSPKQPVVSCDPVKTTRVRIRGRTKKSVVDAARKEADRLGLRFVRNKPPDPAPKVKPVYVTTSAVSRATLSVNL